MIDTTLLDAILPLVTKPGRYTGGEIGAVYKEKDDLIRFLWAFPDGYEVGMSHLGTQIMYQLLNEREDTYVERVYAPFPDMQAQMERHQIPLFSLETKREAMAFDIIGFNLSYEMCYSTVLRMLQLAGIPLRTCNRDESFPLIIAGGTCVFNPEPIADFIDLFVLGEGEEVTEELLDLYKTHKAAGYQKETFLKEAAKIEGIYAPSLVQPLYHEDGTIKGFTGEYAAAKKRYVTDFDKSYYPPQMIVPNIDIVHDRVVLEIFRGCTRGCRFCQAGFLYRPIRERKKETLLGQAKILIAQTGYDELSLSSLSSGDYSEIGALSCELLDLFAQEYVSVSLPSLRVDSFAQEYAARMQDARKSGFTFAPEAGTQRMRDIINKNVTEEEIMRGVEYAFLSGASTVKLYFMIGLPWESYEDLDGIADLVHKIRALYQNLPREKRRGQLKINVGVASFVPKPFTPFQWWPQDTVEVLQEKQFYLKDKLKIKGVRYSWHDTRVSFLEAVFARGDRKLADVLEYATLHGAQFDSWQDMFLYNIYEDAFEKTEIDPVFYANRAREYEEIFPWDHIDIHVKKDFLIRECERAKQEKTTPDCREGCLRCGNFDGVYCNA